MDVSDRINYHIDAAFAAKRAAELRREYLGASAIGNPCLRALQYGYVGAPIDEGRMTGKSLRIFDVGHRFEEAAVEWLRMAGFTVDTIDPAKRGQWGFSILDDEGQGHVDAILRGGPVPLAYPCLWECKALNEKGWQAIKKKGLAIAKPIYAAQVAINQAYLELHEAPALFTTLNKNTSELTHELVPFDQGLAQTMSDRMAQVIIATQEEVLLPRAYASPDYYECKWCDFAKTCWKVK